LNVPAAKTCGKNRCGENQIARTKDFEQKTEARPGFEQKTRAMVTENENFRTGAQIQHEEN
jgi:hypothetical protein